MKNFISGDNIIILDCLREMIEEKEWPNKMYRMIGKKFEINSIRDGGIDIIFDDDKWYLPYGTFEKTDIIEIENDIINHPSHYTFFKKEVIDTIRDCLTPEEFIGYLKGNMIKYRMRAGIKGGTEKRKEDLDKSNWYQDKLNSVL